MSVWVDVCQHHGEEGGCLPLPRQPPTSRLAELKTHTETHQNNVKDNSNNTIEYTVLLWQRDCIIEKCIVFHAILAVMIAYWAEKSAAVVLTLLLLLHLLSNLLLYYQIFKVLYSQLPDLHVWGFYALTNQYAGSIFVRSEPMHLKKPTAILTKQVQWQTLLFILLWQRDWTSNLGDAPHYYLSHVRSHAPLKIMT